MFQDASYQGPSGLPHPEADAQFYENVPQRRLVAWVIDAVIVGAGAALVFVGTLGMAMFIMPLVLIGLSFAYRLVTIRAASATIGMRIVGIQLRDRRGLKFDQQTTVIHTALYIIATILFPLQLISCLTMYKSRYGQGLHDMMLGSTAINAPADF